MNESLPNADTLVGLCQLRLLAIIEEENHSARLINELCKCIPMHLLDPILAALVDRNPTAVPDSALLAFLVPHRTRLDLPRSTHLRNSTLKQIGYNCRDLRSLNLSDCVQVSNAVVRVVLVECRALEELRLDRCHRVTDSAFDMQQSPFQVLAGCLSLKAISLKGCPQVSGQIVHTLNSVCRNLKYLNLSQCKQIQSAAIQEIFDHTQLRCLNLSFIDEVSDEAFCLLPTYLKDITHVSPLETLNVGHSKITDQSLFRMAYLAALTEIRLQFCSGLTDDGIVALSRHCRQLRLIDLKSCAITDVSVDAVASGCRDLEVLDLSWCGQVGDPAISQLAERCRHLKKLFLVWCSQLTDASLIALQNIATLDTLEVQGCLLMNEDAVQSLRDTGLVVNF